MHKDPTIFVFFIRIFRIFDSLIRVSALFLFFIRMSWIFVFLHLYLFKLRIKPFSGLLSAPSNG